MPKKRISSAASCMSPDWFETILCSLNDGVYCVDKELKITCFNQAAARITGVPREKALGMLCCDVFGSSICEKGCPLRRTMETGNPFLNLAVIITTPKGEKKPISISTALLRDMGGKVVGGVGTFRDLSLVHRLRKELDARFTFQDIISKSPKMQHIFDTVPTIGESDSTVLITGESGTGKNLVARAVHNTSHRGKGPFISVNCGAIPDTLLESELFGYKAGAFTDARHEKPGRFALAQGGTLFLDEIGDISIAVQSKLLRVLQEKVYEPLGGVKEVRADVRIVAATNRNLEELVQEEKFRADLYYRVNVIHLHLPPLRERPEDVPLLTEHFISHFSALKEKDISGIHPEAMGILMNHPFQGNVRELENIIEHAFVMCPGGMIEAVHLPDHLKDKAEPQLAGGLKRVDQYEKELILSALERSGWNRLETAKALGIHKATLFRKIKKHGIVVPRHSAENKRLQ